MQNVPTLADVLSSEEDDSCKDVSNDIITKREDVIKNILDQLPKICRTEAVIVLLMKISEKVFPSNSSFYKRLSFGDQEYDVRYHRMVHCEFLAQALENSVRCLGEKLLQHPLDNPHFGIHWTDKARTDYISSFLKFIIYNYISVKSDWNDHIDRFFNCADAKIWNMRLEDYRSYACMEYDFSITKSKSGQQSVHSADRASKKLGYIRNMLMMFNLISFDKDVLPRMLRMPRLLKENKTFTYPLLDYDINNLLEKLMENSNNQELLPLACRNVGTQFIKESNANYLNLVDFSSLLCQIFQQSFYELFLECLMFKLGIKTGLRLGSLGPCKCPEKSLKVNDVKITMLGPQSFQMQLMVRNFKTGDRPTRFDIYPDNDDAFDCNLLMVIYLGVRGLFVHPLSVCIQNQNFEIRNINELLFPKYNRCSYLVPLDLHASQNNLTANTIIWFEQVTSTPRSFVDHTATRKGHFITQFTNALQTSPYSSTRKIYNYIISRTGWKSRICFKYGRYPSMSVDSLKELHIHHVEKAKESGCPKPLAIDLVITATTAARPLPDETDPAFVQYFKEELDKRKELDKYYEGFIEYLENLGLKEHNTIVADSLIKMKGHIHSTSTKRHTQKKRIFRAWRETVAELVNDVDYIRPSNKRQFREIDLLSIANEPLNLLDHVFSEEKNKQYLTLWCRDCQEYINFKDKRTTGHPAACMKNKKLIDRRFIKFFFKPAGEQLSCGCLRGKCLKYSDEITKLLNFKSLSATARLCYTNEELDNVKSFKECIKQVFMNRILCKFEIIPTCVHEIFRISCFEYFPKIDEDDWNMIWSKYYCHY